MRIYVGNLNYTTTEHDLEDAFRSHGTVDSATVVIDRQSGRSRGFGFVEMPNDDEARSAIQALNGTDLQGRALTVNEARPRAAGGGGGREWGGGGGGGGRPARSPRW